MTESGINGIGMPNLGGATTKATYYRFRGVIVECDPANHDVLRRDRRRNGRATILTHGKRRMEGSASDFDDRVPKKRWSDGRLARPAQT